jgi:hypothetical protein
MWPFPVVQLDLVADGAPGKADRLQAARQLTLIYMNAPDAPGFLVLLQMVNSARIDARIFVAMSET